MTPRELIHITAEQYHAAGIPDPENDAALLLTHLTGRPSLELRLDADSETDPAVMAAYQDFVQKRLKGSPCSICLVKHPFSAVCSGWIRGY